MSKKDIGLVIDASVASSAGTTDHPVSKACRDTLGCVQNHQYMLVMTRDIFVEWKKHTSKYASTWLSTMIAKKRVLSVTIEPDNALRAQLSQLDFPPKAVEAMMKDVHQRR